MINVHFIIGAYHPQHPNLKSSMYNLARKTADKYAKRIGRELAEGPTLYLLDNIYGPVELWPLVVEVENAVSG